MHKELERFLFEYLEWAEAGAPRHSTFDRECGLCDNLDMWCENLHEDDAWDVTEEFLSLLPKTGDPEADRFPFGKDDYYARSREGTLHECPLRLEFVRKVLKEAENDA